MSDASGSAAITAAIRAAPGTAICGYVTAGYPTMEEFGSILAAVAASADVVEIGVPFTDPMADGLTIQQAGQVALAGGVTLEWILELLGETALGVPHLLMGYYNPFLAFGLNRLGAALEQSSTAGLIIPDLPPEESGPIREVLDPLGLAAVQLVAPTTSRSRLRLLAAAGGGFVYAVTTTGVTGGDAELTAESLQYLDRVRAAATLPVLAGFGVRQRRQVADLAAHVDGVIVGSALIEAIDKGEDPGGFLNALRPAEVTE